MVSTYGIVKTETVKSSKNMRQLKHTQAITAKEFATLISKIVAPKLYAVDRHDDGHMSTLWVETEKSRIGNFKDQMPIAEVIVTDMDAGEPIFLAFAEDKAPTVVTLAGFDTLGPQTRGV